MERLPAGNIRPSFNYIDASNSRTGRLYKHFLNFGFLVSFLQFCQFLCSSILTQQIWAATQVARPFHSVTFHNLVNRTSHNILVLYCTRFKKMVFSSLALCTLLVATPFAAAADTMVYTAVLGPFGDNSQVTGKVAVFHSENDMNVAYSGSAALLEKTATDSTCAEVNGKRKEYNRSMKEKMLLLRTS